MKNNRITTTELQKYMNVKSASITDMMQLEGMDLVDYKKYQGVINQFRQKEGNRPS